MNLDHDELVDFVRKHAPLAERGSLTRAASRPFDPKHPKLFMTSLRCPIGSMCSVPDPPTTAVSRNRTEFQERLGKTPFNRLIADTSLR